jgi:hypothetical protein
VDGKDRARVTNWEKEGDILLVTKLDRLARSLRDIVNVLHTITQEKNAHFKVTTNPAMDTTSIYGKALIGMLGSFAELERDLKASCTTDRSAAVGAPGGAGAPVGSLSRSPEPDVGGAIGPGMAGGEGTAVGIVPGSIIHPPSACSTVRRSLAHRSGPQLVALAIFKVK